MGCYATRDPQAVSRLPGVFEVVRDKRELPDVLGRLGVVDMPRGISHFDGHKRAFVKVQDGCILNCTYCIIPHVRPGLSSRSPDDIEDEVRRLVGNGYREIVLSGIHVGHYGVDIDPRAIGPAAVSAVAPVSPARSHSRATGGCGSRASRRPRSTTTSSRPPPIANTSARNFIRPCKAAPTPCCGGMRRRYSVSRFLEKIERMRERLDRPAFTTDMIVGFPGETDDDFEHSVETCRRVGFLKVHVFPFSARAGTKAATFPDAVPPPVIRATGRPDQRSGTRAGPRLLPRRSRTNRSRSWSNRRVPERPGFVRGTDRRYAPVELPGDANDLGGFVAAVGEFASKDCLFARRAGH